MTDKGRYQRRTGPSSDAAPVLCVRCRTKIAGVEPYTPINVLGVLSVDPFVTIHRRRAAGPGDAETGVMQGNENGYEVVVLVITCQRCGTEHLVSPESGHLYEARHPRHGVLQSDVWDKPD